MAQDDGAKPGGLFGWLLAILAALSILPAGILKSGPARTTKPGPADAVAGAADADGGKSGDGTKGWSEGPLDRILRSAIGLPAVKDECPETARKTLRGGIESLHGIDSLILCVADPSTSAVAFRADLQFDALQKALGAHGYVPDRWFLPWKENQSGAGSPGLIIFRNTSGKSDRNLLMVYVVGEWMTSGIDREAFRTAVCHIDSVKASARNAKCRKYLPILGPVFTGSLDSLGMAIAEARDRWKDAGATPVILNWSASSANVERLKGLAGVDTLRYGETLLSTKVMWKGVSDYLEGSYLKTPRVAWLSESGTQLGMKVDTDDTLPRTFYPFPAGISRVRDAYAGEIADHAGKNTAVAPTDGAILHFPTKDRENVLDAFPRFDAGMQGPYVELVLRQILLDISRNDFDVVGITATDHRDRMFLAQQIRRYAPGCQIVLLGGDLAHEHPDYRQSLRGTLVASTYPMFPTNQGWSFPRDQGSRYVFASQAGYALFNAVSVAVGLQNRRATFVNDTPSPCLIGICDEDLPFVEYGMPHDGGADDPSKLRCPPLWISVLGDQGVWPVKCIALDSDSSENLVRIRAENTSDKDGANDIHDTHPLSLRLILLMQAIAAILAAWGVGVFGADDFGGRTPDWVRPMREWWSDGGAHRRYESQKARRLFLPLVVGLAALLIQVMVCATHQWALLVLDMRHHGFLVLLIGAFPILIGSLLVWPLQRPSKTLRAIFVAIFLTTLAALPAMLSLKALVGNGTLASFTLLSILPGILLSGAIGRIVARRLAVDRREPTIQNEVDRLAGSGQSDPAPDVAADTPENPRFFRGYPKWIRVMNDFFHGYLDQIVTILVAVIHAAVLAIVWCVVRESAIWLPWLTTSSWLLNGVSPLLPLILSCLAIGVICRSEWTRCWRIDMDYVPAADGLRAIEPVQESQEKDNVAYPVSGMEAAELAKQAWRWIRDPQKGDDARVRLEGDLAPRAYLVLIGFGLFFIWLVSLLYQVRPVYPFVLINFGMTCLILFGYLTWAVIFAQWVALRFRFFAQLRDFRREVNENRELAESLAGKTQEDRWLGRLLFTRRDDPTTEAGSPAPAREKPDRASGIRSWVAFLGSQLRIGAIGLGLGALLLFVAVSSLPFQPRTWFQFTATMTFVAIGTAVVSTILRVDADPVLRLIAGDTQGKPSLDWGQILKLAPWVLVPLVMVLGQTFPELWNWLGVMLDSWRTP